jgi:hypothetical protein
LLFSDSGKVDYPEFRGVEKTINDYISNAVKGNQAEDVSIYYRDLNSAKWIGINEDEDFMPSSMLKVATLIGYLKEAEKDPGVLSKKLHYVAQTDPGQYFKPAHPLPTGDYSVEELLQAMITESDNFASDLLIANNTPAVLDVYSKLRLPYPPKNLTDFMSAKTYSVIYRILYNSSYLTRSDSESALKMLSETNFTQGLAGGVPNTVTISHKFGEHTIGLSDGSIDSRELHDCGIVYYPDHPYFLCIMTKGKEFASLQNVISNISKIVYNNEVQLYKSN